MELVKQVRRYWVLVVIMIMMLVVGVASGWYLHAYVNPPIFHSVRETSSEFKFISPFLYLEVPESTLPHYRNLKDKLTGAVNSAIKSGGASDVAVYVRDMSSGQWVAVNADHTFALASMLKVVTVMTVLHQAEAHPSTIASNVTVAQNTVQNSAEQAYYPPANPIVPGVSYTMEQMFWHDMVESDNAAENALEAYIGLDTIKQTFNDLHLPVPPTTSTDIDTPQEYSHLFRVLYGATYLSRENSQALLDLLSRTTFTAGLVAGVPAGTTVSHKFGEGLVPTSSAADAPVTKELHDCGIVYYPGHPYFICVTTKGDDFPTLAGVIKDISAVGWEQMKAINGT